MDTKLDCTENSSTLCVKLTASELSSVKTAGLFKMSPRVFLKAVAGAKVEKPAKAKPLFKTGSGWCEAVPRVFKATDKAEAYTEFKVTMPREYLFLMDCPNYKALKNIRNAILRHFAVLEVPKEEVPPAKVVHTSNRVVLKEGKFRSRFITEDDVAASWVERFNPPVKRVKPPVVAVEPTIVDNTKLLALQNLFSKAK